MHHATDSEGGADGQGAAQVRGTPFAATRLGDKAWLAGIGGTRQESRLARGGFLSSTSPGQANGMQLSACWAQTPGGCTFADGLKHCLPVLDACNGRLWHVGRAHGGTGRAQLSMYAARAQACVASAWNTFMQHAAAVVGGRQ